MRGTRSTRLKVVHRLRFIPVGAGNSFSEHRSQLCQAVYPRGCGELWLRPCGPRLVTGLSPWVRGTLKNEYSKEENGRFIPVGAGNSTRLSLSTATMTVYPRGCGELVASAIPAPMRYGLSPWVRGTRRNAILFESVTGFIPVGAGNSLSGCGTVVQSAVYPRGCGELTVRRNLSIVSNGLSPWVRGTRSRGVGHG